MNVRRRATIDQQKSIRVLEGAGYMCVRAADAESFADIIAIGSTDLILLRVASHAWPDGDEIEEFRKFRCPDNVRKLIHRWRELAHTPDVKEI